MTVSQDNKRKDRAVKQSLPGLFRNTARALQESPNDMACAMAFSLGQLVDNLRIVKDGGATLDEFFDHYVFDTKDASKLADSVNPDHYVCMKDDAAKDDEAA